IFCPSTGTSRPLDQSTSRESDTMGYFVCTECGNKFVKKCHLRDHMRIHSGEKPFSCPCCKMSFREKSALKKHISGVHKMKLIYSCITCDGKFDRVAELNEHLFANVG
ncbi:hypothetical protein PMAYCL1PPCAC_00810, partial [Pristionchus mayeri]